MKRKIIIYSLLILIVLYLTYNIVAICNFCSVSSDKSCDCIIVLGAAASDNGVSNVYAERLNHAKILYEENRAVRIIVTGGLGEGNSKSDAKAAMEYLVSSGVPEAVIIEEDSSTITQENLENAASIMSKEGLQSALIVSDPLHMRRAMLISEDVGIDAYPSPTQTSAYVSLKTKIPFAARELLFFIGYKWYRLFE